MVGDRLPDITLPLVISNKISQVNLIDLTRGKSILFIGHPGAFTYYSTKEQFPDYKASGITQEIIIWSVNDPFVIRRYMEKYQIDYPMLCDFNGVLTRTFELGLPEEEYFSFCCRRAICLIKDSLILGVSLENNVQYTKSTNPTMAKHLSQVILNF